MGQGANQGQTQEQEPLSLLGWGWWGQPSGIWIELSAHQRLKSSDLPSPPGPSQTPRSSP